MEDGVTNGEHSLDLSTLRRTLLGNSTKRRSAELHSLRERIHSKGGVCPTMRHGVRK